MFENDIDLTIQAPVIVDDRNKVWDAVVEGVRVSLQRRTLPSLIDVSDFTPEEADRLGRRLCAAAAAAKAAQQS